MLGNRSLRVRRRRSRLALRLPETVRVAAAFSFIAVAGACESHAAPILYGAGSGAWDAASRWGTVDGTFTKTWVGGDDAVFNVANTTVTGASVSINNITANENVTFTAGGTLSLSATSTVTVAQNKILDFDTQKFATGSGIIKAGAGEMVIRTTTLYTGSVTLSAGTVTVGSGTAFGKGLIINGGVIRTNGSTVDFQTNLTTAFNIAGDFTIGAAADGSTGNSMSFGNDVSLGNATRTITNDSNGDTIFSGALTGATSAVGLTLTSTTGSNTGMIYFAPATPSSNKFGGVYTLKKGAVAFTTDRAFGAVPGSATAGMIVIDGGQLTICGLGKTDVTYAISSNRGIQVSAAAGSAINVLGAGVLTYSGIIADKPATAGILVKQGTGTLVLGGVNTYSGDTTINAGTMRMLVGANRLPTGTTVSLGQASTTNVGTLDLNGFSQQIAGLNSIAGTNAGLLKNTITSGTAATLTLGGSGTYSFGSGTAANSGTITGAISLIKSGTGTQTLGDGNAFTGTTAITGGTLIVGIDSLANLAPVAGTSGGSGATTTITLSAGTTAGMMAGASVTGTGIAANTVVASVTDASHFVVNNSPGSVVNLSNVVVGRFGVFGDSQTGGAISVGTGATLAIASGVTLGRVPTFASGASLAGKGTYSPGGTFAAGVHVAPGIGAATDRFGTLTMGAATTLAKDSVLEIDLDMSATPVGGYGVGDQLDVAGAITVADGAKLVLNILNGVAGPSQVPRTFKIIDASAASSFGTFSISPASAGTVQFDTSFDSAGGDFFVRVTAVPEPASAAVLAIVTLFSLRRRTRLRR